MKFETLTECVLDEVPVTLKADKLVAKYGIEYSAPMPEWSDDISLDDKEKILKDIQDGLKYHVTKRIVQVAVQYMLKHSHVSLLPFDVSSNNDVKTFSPPFWFDEADGALLVMHPDIYWTILARGEDPTIPKRFIVSDQTEDKT